MNNSAFNFFFRKILKKVPLKKVTKIMEKIEFLSIFKKQAIHTEAKSIFLSKLVILANFSTFQNKLRNLKKKSVKTRCFSPMVI